jgi:hypothetical protein
LGESNTPYENDLKGNRLEQRAITQRWPVKEIAREPMVNRQIAIAIDPNGKPKDATAAFRAVLVADAVNLEEERRERKIPTYVEHHHSGSVTMEQRREFFVMLGEALADYPEAKDRIGKLLEERIRLNSER